tara:strand:+ start:68077 stop:68250 length:174 start_codon:yes stop_codon:yes gene_type:complete
MKENNEVSFSNLCAVVFLLYFDWRSAATKLNRYTKNKLKKQVKFIRLAVCLILKLPG